MPKHVIVLRGLPGAGKSTFAAWLAKGDRATVICSADGFIKGEVNKDSLAAAHAECKDAFMRALRDGNGISTVVIDNTNISRWEWAPYVATARAMGHMVHLVTVEMDESRPSIHGVPDGTMKNMSAKYVMAAARELTP